MASVTPAGVLVNPDRNVRQTRVPGQGIYGCGDRTRGGMLILMRTHQPDQDVFRSVRPEDIDWKPFPDVIRTYLKGQVVIP